MKRKMRPVILCVMLTVLSACGQADNTVENIKSLTEENVIHATESSELAEETTEAVVESERFQAETNISEAVEELEVEPDPYVGQYNDYFTDSPDLQIQKNADGTYMVQVGVFRITFLDNCVGMLTENGIEFRSVSVGWEDMTGVITLDGDIATVTFTSSSWNDYSSVNTYEYYKTSDVPNIYKLSTFSGEYTDYTTGEPNLQIRKNADETYTIQLGVPGVVYLEDGVGEIAGLGLEFAATAPNGEKITGVLKLREEKVIVVFDEAVWSQYSDITEYKYYKVSDTPNIKESTAEFIPIAQNRK